MPPKAKADIAKKQKAVEDKTFGIKNKNKSKQVQTTPISDQAVSFPTLEAQGRWVAYAISGKVKLPSKEEMLASVEEYNKTLEKNGVPKHHTHSLPLGVSTRSCHRCLLW